MRAKWQTMTAVCMLAVCAAAGAFVGCERGEATPDEKETGKSDAQLAREIASGPCFSDGRTLIEKCLWFEALMWNSGWDIDLHWNPKWLEPSERCHLYEDFEKGWLIIGPTVSASPTWRNSLKGLPLSMWPDWHVDIKNRMVVPSNAVAAFISTVEGKGPVPKLSRKDLNAFHELLVKEKTKMLNDEVELKIIGEELAEKRLREFEKTLQVSSAFEKPSGED